MGRTRGPDLAKRQRQSLDELGLLLAVGRALPWRSLGKEQERRLKAGCGGEDCIGKSLGVWRAEKTAAGNCYRWSLCIIPLLEATNQLIRPPYFRLSLPPPGKGCTAKVGFPTVNLRFYSVEGIRSFFQPFPTHEFRQRKRQRNKKPSWRRMTWMGVG